MNDYANCSNSACLLRRHATHASVGYNSACGPQSCIARYGEEKTQLKRRGETETSTSKYSKAGSASNTRSGRSVSITRLGWLPGVKHDIRKPDTKYAGEIRGWRRMSRGAWPGRCSKSTSSFDCLRLRRKKIVHRVIALSIKSPTEPRVIRNDAKSVGGIVCMRVFHKSNASRICQWVDVSAYANSSSWCVMKPPKGKVSRHNTVRKKR